MHERFVIQAVGLDAKVVEAFTILEEHCYCQKLEDDADMWQFTELGAMSLQFRDVVSGRKRLHNADDNLPLQDRTPFALLDFLERSGWEAVDISRTAAAPDPYVLPTIMDDPAPKLFFVDPSHPTFSKWYLAVLAQTEDEKILSQMIRAN